ncbi:hypothetical protein AB0N81_11930 [Streptomyces sp. NPDC093510]|uniref:hypothetical protein n=1 Tax=Streptomyces sp. NPDC093510 TaxID=3155199 RepID=UPI003412E0C2
MVADQLDPGPRGEIEAALGELGVERRLGATVTEVGDGYAVLSGGARIEADVVVWCAGLAASDLTRQLRRTRLPGPVAGGPAAARAPRRVRRRRHGCSGVRRRTHGHAGLPARRSARQGGRVQRGGRPARRAAARLHARPVRHLPGPGRCRCGRHPGG